MDPESSYMSRRSTADARQLGRQVSTLTTCEYWRSSVPNKCFSPQLQELDALEKAVIQAQSAANSGRASGPPPRHDLHDEPEVSSRPKVHAPTTHGTPWTVNNAALPAYPPVFTPQLPFVRGKAHWEAMHGRLRLCSLHAWACTRVCISTASDILAWPYILACTTSAGPWDNDQNASTMCIHAMPFCLLPTS